MSRKSSLSLVQIDQAIQAARSGQYLADIAYQFKVSQSVVRHILKRRGVAIINFKRRNSSINPNPLRADDSGLVDPDAEKKKLRLVAANEKFATVMRAAGYKEFVNASPGTCNPYTVLVPGFVATKSSLEG